MFTLTPTAFAVEYPAGWVARTYGEHGYRGREDIKVLMYRSRRSPDIMVRRKSPSNPSLDDVVKWNYFASIYRFKPEPKYEELFLEQDTINGERIIRRRYRYRTNVYEDVHIARERDMIVISLHGTVDDFEAVEDEFRRVVESFPP